MIKKLFGVFVFCGLVGMLVSTCDTDKNQTDNGQQQITQKPTRGRCSKCGEMSDQLTDGGMLIAGAGMLCPRCYLAAHEVMEEQLKQMEAVDHAIRRNRFQN